MCDAFEFMTHMSGIMISVFASKIFGDIFDYKFDNLMIFSTRHLEVKDCIQYRKIKYVSLRTVVSRI